MPTRTVTLTDHLDRFVESGVTSGRFNNASEVVCEGLRLLEQRESEDLAKLDWLRATAKDAFDAFDRGEGIPIENIHDFVSQAVAEGRAARRSV
jgi:antitoxin ParD1/3/4